MPNINTWDILAILFCFAYQMLLFNYSSKILVNGRKNMLQNSILAVLNTVIVIILSLPVWMSYLIVIPVLMIEFWLMSKTRYRQLIAGASIFALHIAMVHYTSLVIVSSMFGVPTNEVVSNRDMNNQLYILVFALLILILLAVSVAIDTKMITRITSSEQYSEMLAGVAFLFTILITVDVYFLIEYKEFPQQVFYSLTTVLIMAVLIYFILLYAINMLTLHKFKRFADSLDETYNEILTQKKTIANKIDKDDLTGLFNRKFVQEILEGVFHTDDLQLGILFVDINGLKFVNDNFGHASGDKLINCIAKSLTRTLREDDIAARVGGDEFIAILNNTTQEQLEGVVKRLKREIDMHDELEDFPVSVSIGAKRVTDEMRSEGISKVLADADAEMRKNKAAFYESRESRYLK